MIGEDTTSMKTETNSVQDIWSTNVELPHFTSENEECLPVIGSCQVSSILSNLDTPSDKTQHNNETPQSMQLIVLQNSDYNKTNQNDTETISQKNFIILKDINSKNTTTCNRNEEKNGKTSKHDNLEDMLYFVCDICPFLCTENAKITEHLENSHKNKNTIKLMHLKCPACPNIFYHKVSLRSHLIHDHSVTSSDINRIIKAVVYFSKKKGSYHKNEKPNAKVSFKNENIDFKYNSDSKKLLENVETISNENCDEHDLTENQLPPEKICVQQQPKVISLPTVDITRSNAEKMFNSMIKQQNSVSKYLDQKKMHKCIIPMCKVYLQDANKMNYHIGCHVENSFTCLECNMTFAFWKPLTGHLWRVHKIDMELYSCDRCDYKTFSLGKLNNIHKLIHSDVKAFVCDVCKKGFKNSKQLRNHKITHKEKSEKSSYACEICAKTFFDKRQLRVHLDSVHKKIKPFLCNFCGYKGSSKSALKMHIRQHTGEKPFACDSCNYTTADHNSLRRHKLRHSGVKPYKCAHCDYACIQSTTYKVHLKTKHPGLEKDLMFTCPECQFRFVNKDLYKSHILTAHKGGDLD